AAGRFFGTWSDPGSSPGGRVVPDSSWALTDTLYLPGTGPSCFGISNRPPSIIPPAATPSSWLAGWNWIVPFCRGWPSKVTVPETASRGRLSSTVASHPKGTATSRAVMPSRPQQRGRSLINMLHVLGVVYAVARTGPIANQPRHRLRVGGIIAGQWARRNARHDTPDLIHLAPTYYKGAPHLSPIFSDRSRSHPEPSV